MTWIRKYILNRIVSYALCLYAIFFFIYVNVDNNFRGEVILSTSIIILLPVIFYLSYVHYLNRIRGTPCHLECYGRTSIGK